MEAIKLSITLCVLLTAFLLGGMALARDSSVFDSASSDSKLEAPKFTVTIAGTKVTLSWTKVDGASYYDVYYAQYPYDKLGGRPTRRTAKIIGATGKFKGIQGDM